MASAELTSLESTQAVPTVETPSDEEQVNVDTPTWGTAGIPVNWDTL
ncbi:hypothetical protein H6G91_38220 [Nostoc muscorum FACHB-395]|jgi:hypothetical protein|nr:hypothetical protein [Desmonostoc muscorum FACHB-395]